MLKCYIYVSGPAGQSTPPCGDARRLRSSFGLRPGNISSQYTVQSTTRRHLLTLDVYGLLSVFVQVTSHLNILYNPPPDVTC
jgi:hypothetical protein